MTKETYRNPTLDTKVNYSTSKIKGLRSFTKTEMKKELMVKFKYPRSYVVLKDKDWLVEELTRLYKKEKINGKNQSKTDTTK